MNQNFEHLELNFLGFTESLISPAERDLQECLAMEHLPISADYHRATLIEAAGWLHLGAAIGYFPSGPAADAIKSIMLHPVLDVAQFLKDWGYMLDPFVRSQCEAWLAVPGAIIPPSLHFESAEETKNLFRFLLLQEEQQRRDGLEPYCFSGLLQPEGFLGEHGLDFDFS